MTPQGSGRRCFLAAAPVLCAGAASLPACSQDASPETAEAVALRIRRPAAVQGMDSAALSSDLMSELVRFATLAPSSHNTQCWKFALDSKAITILPDLARRCPAVDSDDHHLFVSLGCATENLVHAALAHGLHAQARFDPNRDAVQVAMTPATAQRSPLFAAITARQCTRGDYDGKPLSSAELSLLEQAGSSANVRLLLLTERPAMERVLDFVVLGNSAQMADPAFVKELKVWIRFNGADAVRTGDGLFSLASGSPAVPDWLGQVAFGAFFTPKGENDKYMRQIRSSAGLAVFVGQAADKANWVEVGRCYERFALQATALGIRNAHLNQPIEVARLRPDFAAALGLPGQRPDLVLRFGRGATLPYSLRRSVQTVMV